MASDRGVDGARRHILTSGTTAFLGLLGGCSTIADWRVSQANQKAEKIPRLCKKFELINHDDKPHTFHVVVERDGEIVDWWTSEEVPSKRGAVTELGSWHQEQGNYAIYASYDDHDEYSRNDLSDRELEKDEACILVNVRINREGHVLIITSIKGKSEYPTRKENTG